MFADALDWLKKPGLVVVDECHHAITPSYTALLSWLDAEAPRAGAKLKDEPPFIGLSATPFRTDDEESQRLAKRFDSRWFPARQEDLHKRLRQDCVLSEVDTEELATQATLTPEEVQRLSEIPEPWIGLEFDHFIASIDARLALDAARNRLLVQGLKNAPEQSILFFANSVSHAKLIAAQLTLAGVPAAAVSGDTPTNARRYFLYRFQRREIKVLCNHSVLTTGFDAPKVEMIMISRQIFSPVRYMQIVGRGLRGSKNGGTPRCRVVTVMDNLGRFQNKHAYHYCSRYFA